jgi:aspartyl-tRNA(Asn)/glutamyl-tRNA(Gln) amidotransferase subunit B
MAVDYEARRQIEILEDGGKIEQETRLFDASKNETRSMRNKKKRTTTVTSPTPSPAARIRCRVCGKSQISLPELPDEKKTRFAKDWSFRLRRRRAGK